MESPALHSRRGLQATPPASCLLNNTHLATSGDVVATLSSPAKPLPAGGAGEPSKQRAREGKELVFLKPTPRGPSPDTNREIRATTVLFCGLDIILNRKKASEMYCPISNLLVKNLWHFSKINKAYETHSKQKQKTKTKHKTLFGSQAYLTESFRVTGVYPLLVNLSCVPSGLKLCHKSSALTDSLTHSLSGAPGPGDRGRKIHST